MSFKNTAVLAFLAGLPVLAVPCEAIGADGKPVQIASETAIIIWDGKKHEEHFIRSANFKTEARDLGFLVPTPTLPKLTAVKPDVFDKLAIDTESLKGVKDAAAKDDTPKADVSPVISESHVGGYEATVLSLEDMKGLTKWLMKHNFPLAAKTTDWLAPYAKKGWVITAFRVESRKGKADLKPVRMTFRSDSPFYPYREPAQRTDSDDGRSLEVFFLSDQQYVATLGDKPWAVREEVSASLLDDQLADLRKSLPGVDLPASLWLTTFWDASNPRVGSDDVYFAPGQPLPEEYKEPSVGYKFNVDWQAVGGGVFIAALILFFGLGFAGRRKR